MGNARTPLLISLLAVLTEAQSNFPTGGEISDSTENTLPVGCNYAKHEIVRTKKYDLCAVGAGLSGTVFAERTAALLGETVLVIDSRPHIGGNCFDFMDNKTGVLRNQYGSHLFHTNIERVWRYVNHPKAPPWKPWYHQKLGVVNNTLVPIPPNIMTVNRLFDQHIQSPEDMAAWLKAKQIPCPKGGCRNGEEMAKSRVGEELYKAIFETYTIKQWGKSPREMDASVLARIPVYADWDPRYFKDKWQALPQYGYTAWFEAMLKHPLIEVVLGVDFFDHQRHLERACAKIVYTGPIDSYFAAARLEKLEYRSIIFTESRHYNTPGYILPTPVVNYPGPETPYTRAVEYKHYLHRPSRHSVVVMETSSDSGEPYYPVPTQRNRDLYEKYKDLAAEAEKSGKVIFVGRLANYKYFDMDKAIDNALELFYQSAWTKLFKGGHFKSYKADIDAKMELHRSRSVPECEYHYPASSVNPSGGNSQQKNISTPFYRGEFGMELRVMVPWAYSKSRRCKIKTQGVMGTKYMYWFSDEHSIVHTPRNWLVLPEGNPFGPDKGKVSVVHRSTPPSEDAEWKPPPFKVFFDRPIVREMLAEKPLVVIQNKNGGKLHASTANYFDVDELRTILKTLVPKYTVVYKRHVTEVLKDLSDSGHPNQLREKEMIRAEFPSVVMFEDLSDGLEDPEDENLLFFGLLAVSDRFLSPQGGTAVVGSYFGGTNGILLREGWEKVKGDYSYFHLFSNASVVWSSEIAPLLAAVSQECPHPSREPPAAEDARLARLEALILLALHDSLIGSNSSLQAKPSKKSRDNSPAKSPSDDYRATKLMLSPGRSLFATLGEFEFRHYNSTWADVARTPAVSLSPTACVERLVCHIDRSYKNLHRWQHYVQLVFPCWSLFQRFPKAMWYLDIHPNIAAPIEGNKEVGKPWQSWISQLNDQFLAANIQFLDALDGGSLPPGHNHCNWIANKTVKQDDYGWADPTGDGPLHNFSYFMKQGDISALQQVVLGANFAPGPAKNDRIQLLILDRQDEMERSWLYSSVTLDRIRETLGQIVDVRLIPSFQGFSLKEQALAMHTANVIISPHGAQLTNTVFIRPCTVVLELFPRHYYYPKNGLLVMEAGGIAYDGYHFDGSPRSETSAFNASAVTQRLKLRSGPIVASSKSILRALPGLLLDVVSCRKMEATMLGET
eukprot:CAMPEP_0119301942 /NCGR_PEP_ID=MMETSP1333-20130426/3634_1 /TAXON_ID=418940 /ORGANISM="Scyphosphaera apsteinii, Strain RCC1455" /LENGTH=1179 /DNA_ID=CAMNT_0007304155 /DNA_START=97 /DNA_END=3637 /DNA_ORIENTATION=-